VRQQIRFCTAADGVRIALAAHGTGAPIVGASTWLTHLEFDRQSPLWRHCSRDSPSGPVVIAYAARHPERVSHLVLYGTYARGRLMRSAKAREEAELLVSLVRVGWGQANPAFRDRRRRPASTRPGGCQLAPA
jgi:pimeloyl-ACP methyl ester carboxylesterase